MMFCPECKSETSVKVWRQCPRHNSEPVCINCCKKCLYYNPDPKSMLHCMYVLVNKVYEDYREESIKEIRRKWHLEEMS